MLPRAGRRLYSHYSLVMVRVRIPTFRTYPLPQPPQIYPYPFWTDNTDWSCEVAEDSTVTSLVMVRVRIPTFSNTVTYTLNLGPIVSGRWTQSLVLRKRGKAES